MSKNGAGFDPAIEDVPNDLYDDPKTLFVKKLTNYARNKKLAKEKTNSKEDAEGEEGAGIEDEE